MALFYILAVNAKAEWLGVSDFGGVVTSIAPSEMGLELSRSSVGWYHQYGDLSRINIEKKDTFTETPPTQGVLFLAPHENTSSIIWSRGGAFSTYSIDADVSDDLGSAYSDSVKTIADSNIVYFSGADVTNSRWLNLVLADNSPTKRFSIKIGDTYFPTRMFLSDTMVVMSENQSATLDDDTLTWVAKPSGSVGAPLYYFSHGDTTTVIDGDNRTSYAGVELGNIQWPAYSDSGSYDSIGLDQYGDNGPAVGDSLLVFGNFDTSGTGIGGGFHGSYFLWSDNTDSAHGIPFFISSWESDGGAYEHLVLVGDTSAFKATGDDSLYSRHFDHPVAGDQRYLIYSHGLGTYDSTKNYYNRKIIADAGRMDTINIADDGTIMRRLTVKADASCLGIPNCSAPPLWMFDERAFDAAIWRIREKSKLPKDVESHSCRVEAVFGLDSLHLLIWGKGANGYTGQVSAGFLLELHHFPAVPFEPNPEQATFAYDICIPTPHRDRAWYAKDNQVAYSDLNDYYDIAGGGTVTFEKEVTALSSHGNEMVAHLGGNEIQTWTGYAEADFYKVPAPVSVAAMNQASLAHNDRDNSDVFPHPLGLWKYAGSSVQEIPTNCREIFSDSVNWDESKKLVGAVYDDKYWFGYPQTPSTTNNRLLTVDLETGAVSFIGGINPGSFLVRTDPEAGRQLYIGDADSAVIWLVSEDVSEVPYWNEMKSGFYTGGDRGLRKRVTEYTVGYTAHRGDTLVVDFFTGTEAEAWSDTIVVSTGSGQTAGNETQHASPIYAVEGQPEAIGTKFSPTTNGFIDSCRVYMTWGSFDGSDKCTVGVALYRVPGDGSAFLVDSAYTQIFSGGEANGWKTFTFNDNTQRVSVNTDYVLFVRMTVDTSEFTAWLVEDAAAGTQVNVEDYKTLAISSVWAAGMNPGIWTLTESTGNISAFIYYSERIVQQRHWAVPVSVQGTALAYGFRTPSQGITIHDFHMNVVDIGRERP